MRTTIGSALCACTVLAAGSAVAEPVGFEFTGTVTYDTSLAAPGSKVTGHFSYDPDTSPSLAASGKGEQVTGYTHYQIPAPHRLRVRVNGHLVEGVLRADVWNNVGGNTGDMVDITSGYPMVLDGTTYDNGSFGFRLASGYAATDPDPLSSTDLPRHLDVGQFPGMNDGWIQVDGGQTGTLLQFRVDSIRRASPVQR